MLHNTQAWTSWLASLYRPLNAVYMGVMRRIAGACRFGQRGVPFDDEVRQRLGVPSLQCLIIRRRLSLLVALLQSKTMPLVSLLAAVGDSIDQPRMPWTLLIMDDLSALAEFHRSRLSSLGPPCENAAAWESFITEYPHVFKELIQQFIFGTGAYDVSATRASYDITYGGVGAFSCVECAAAEKPIHFATERALKSHARRAHGARNPLRVFLDNTATCPVCEGSYGSRTRCLAHVSEKRCRGKSAVTCPASLESGLYTPLPAVEVERLDVIDRSFRKTARALGHTQPVALAPAKRSRIRGPPLPEKMSPAQPRCTVCCKGARKRMHVKTTCPCTVTHVSRRLRKKTTLPKVEQRPCSLHQDPQRG